MPTRVKALLIVLTAVALGIFGSLAFIGGGGGGCTTPDAIVTLFPECNSSVLGQTEIGVEVATGYRAELNLNGTAIPLDEVTSGGQTPDDPRENPAGNAPTLFKYLPGEGKTIERLDPVNTVTVTYWRITDGMEEARTFQWRFEAA